jgi:hypothetical protein
MIFMRGINIAATAKSYAAPLVVLAVHTLYNPREIHRKLKRDARSPRSKGTAVA